MNLFFLNRDLIKDLLALKNSINHIHIKDKNITLEDIRYDDMTQSKKMKIED